MKKAFTILVLFAVLASTMGKTIVWGWYMANQHYIATTLCENKARPKMKCNGKCQLAKQLKKAEAESKNAPALPQSLKEFKDTEGQTEEHIDFNSQSITALSIHTFVYKPLYSINTTSPLLRPPIA